MVHRIARHGWRLIVGVALAAPAWTGAGQEAHQAAITFDDFPGGEALARQVAIRSRIANALKARGIPAVAFVNERQLYRRGETDSRIGILRDWLDAGLELGNHTFSHVGIDSVSLPVYADAKHRGDVALQGRVLDEYRAYVQENLSFHERLAVEVLGREVRHVVLLHVNHLNADLIDELLATLEKRNSRSCLWRRLCGTLHTLGRSRPRARAGLGSNAGYSLRAERHGQSQGSHRG